MHCIETIRNQNDLAVAKFEAEQNTHWVELPMGRTLIQCVDKKGRRVSGMLDARQSKKFLREIGNHDGKKAYVFHKQDVCRKFVKNAVPVS